MNTKIQLGGGKKKTRWLRNYSIISILFSAGKGFVSKNSSGYNRASLHSSCYQQLAVIFLPKKFHHYRKSHDAAGRHYTGSNSIIITSIWIVFSFDLKLLLFTSPPSGTRTPRGDRVQFRSSPSCAKGVFPILNRKSALISLQFLLFKGVVHCHPAAPSTNLLCGGGHRPSHPT